MNYRDAELLNSSIDSMGQSFLHSRMLDQQKAEAAARNYLGQQQFNVDRERIGAVQKEAAERTAEQQRANVQRVWKDTVDMFGGWVKDGIMPPETAQNSLRQAYEKIPDAQKADVADHPATQAILSNEPIWQKPSKPTPELTPVNTPGFKGALTPGGAYVSPDAERPNEFDKLDYTALGKQLERARDLEAEKKKAVDAFTPAEGPFYNRHSKDAENAAALQDLQDQLAEATAAREAIEAQRTKLRGGKADAPAQTKKQLDPATAKALLQEAGGDKDKARELARKRGYEF